jgi:hypothetical protein
MYTSFSVSLNEDHQGKNISIPIFYIQSKNKYINKVIYIVYIYYTYIVITYIVNKLTINTR